MTADALAWPLGVTFSLLVVVIGAAASAVSIVLLRPFLQRHMLAAPNARSSHRVPTPQGGGIAVVACTVAVSGLAALFLDPVIGPEGLVRLATVLGGAVLVAVVGAVDDFAAIGVAPRMVLQTLAAVAVAAALPASMQLVALLPWWIERALLVLGLVWFINLVNFMDGIDWMTVAETLPILSGLVLIATVGGLPVEATLVALGLAGGMVGFAPFNRPVARIFLGDAGSLPIGLLVGWMLVLVAGRGHLAAALLLPLYYLADTTLTLLRRLARGEPVWQAHRQHFYQRAADGGLAVTDIVGRVFATNVALAALAVATVITASPWVDVVALGAGGVLVGWLLRVLARGAG